MVHNGPEALILKVSSISSMAGPATGAPAEASTAVHSGPEADRIVLRSTSASAMALRRRRRRQTLWSLWRSKSRMPWQSWQSYRAAGSPGCRKAAAQDLAVRWMALRRMALRWRHRRRLGPFQVLRWRHRRLSQGCDCETERTRLRDSIEVLPVSKPAVQADADPGPAPLPPGPAAPGTASRIPALPAGPAAPSGWPAATPPGPEGKDLLGLLPQDLRAEDLWA